MSLTDDLFGSTDTTASDAAWFWRQAVMDMINAEYPGIQDWLGSGYDQAIGSTNNIYGMINDRLTGSLNDQINVLSMVPGMTYNTLANGYNLAGNMMMGAPGSMIQAPSGGYGVPTYGGHSSMPAVPAGGALGGQLPQAPAGTPVPQSFSPYSAPAPTPNMSAPAPAPAAPAQGAAAQPVPTQPAAAAQLPAPTGGLGGTVPVPGGHTENVDGNLTRKPGLDNVVNRLQNPLPSDLVAAQRGATSWQDPIYSTPVPWDNQRNTGMGASPTNPYNYPIHTESALYRGLAERGVDADAVFAQAKEQGVHPARIVYEMGDPGLLSAVTQQDFASGKAGAAGVGDLARVAGVSADEMTQFLGGGPYVAPYQNRDSVINLPEESRSTRTPEWFAARGEASTPQRQVIDDPNYRSPEDQAYYDKFIAPQLEGQTAPEMSAAQANLEAHQAELEAQGSGRPTAEQQAFYDQMISQYGASSPAQGVRAPTTSGYSPLQAAIDATRRELAQNPGNTFAQQKLAEMEAQLAGGTSAAPRLGMMKPESMQSAPLEGEYIPADRTGLSRESASRAMGSGLGGIAAVPQQMAAAGAAPSPTSVPAGVPPGAAAPMMQSTAAPQAGAAPQPGTTPAAASGTAAAPYTGAEFPWQGPQVYGDPLPGTGLHGATSTLNATLDSANNNLAAGGRSAVNAISTGLSQGRNDLLALGGYGLQGLAPYQAAGSAATARMMDLNGLNGAGAQRSAIDGVLASPEFDFYRDEGEQAVLRNAAALGGLRGGNVQKDLVRFGQGLASTQYGTAYDRLSGMSGQGLQASGTAGALSTSMGSNLLSGALGGSTAAAGIIRDTASQQASNTMGTGGMIAGNQYGTGQMLGNMAWDGANTIAGQFPSLATTASGAYQNYGNTSAQAGVNFAGALGGLYTGKAGALANNAYNRWNAAQGLGTFPGVQYTPGTLSQVGQALGGFGSFYDSIWG